MKVATLPPDFVALMHSHLGDEQAEALFEGLAQEPAVSVRFNPRRLDHLRRVQGLSLAPALQADPVPWCPDAYYLPGHRAFTFDPLFHAGAYYVQDASSMYLVEALRKFLPCAQGPTPSAVPLPLAALDLCAAPGGKSTLLASHLPEGSLLVSNEPIARRAQVLAENMQKWCAPLPGTSVPSVPVTSIVTQNYPEDFGHLREAFDLLLTDVPCSGEGMFRKDPVAIREWSLDNVRQCVQRQRDILRAILPTLRPGGLLVYSTCTFNRFEDEEQVRWLVADFGLQLLEERHFLPGRDRGEGLYMAVLRKCQALEALDNLEDLGRLETLDRLDRLGRLDNLGNLAHPVSLENLAQRLRRTLNSIPPQAPVPPDAAFFPLSYADAIRYLRREALHIAAPRGILCLTYCGLPLGLAKSVGTRLNNLYPPEWRIRTTYSPQEPLPDLFLP